MAFGEIHKNIHIELPVKAFERSKGMLVSVGVYSIPLSTGETDIMCFISLHEGNNNPASD